MGFYNQNAPKEPDHIESSNYAFPLLVAYTQLALVAWFLYTVVTARGFDVIVMLFPLYIMRVIAPLCFFTSLYYEIHYRHDPASKRVIVGIAFVASLLSIGPAYDR